MGCAATAAAGLGALTNRRTGFVTTLPRMNSIDLTRANLSLSTI
jgi:hypothetical protein